MENHQEITFIINTTMKRLFIFSFLLGTYLSQIHATLTGSIEDSLDVEREHWTEEQYQHYEDSILNRFFPEPQVVEVEQSGNADSKTNIRYSNPTRQITNNVVPDAINLDYSKSVGEIPILSGVSPSGAKTYDSPSSYAQGRKTSCRNSPLPTTVNKAIPL
jgi:hypothetical protein